MLTPEGKEILRQVADHIIAEPKRLNMGSWIERKSREDQMQRDGYARSVGSYDFAECGTTGCVAGWIILLHDGAEQKFADVTDIRGRAAELLGMDYWDVRKLFYVESWNEPYSTQYTLADSVEAKAKVAYDYIHHAIETM